MAHWRTPRGPETEWREVFAWLPVRTDLGWRWICWVERCDIGLPDYLWHRWFTVTKYRAL